MSPSEFADLIESHREEVVDAWMDAVRTDPRIHTDDDLPEYSLRDHVPAMIEELCQLLREGELPSAANTQEGRVHTYLRFRQGYRGRELACELSHLRLAILDAVAAEMADAGIDVEPFTRLSKTVHSYIDEEMRYAFAIYTEAEKQAQPDSHPEKDPH